MLSHLCRLDDVAPATPPLNPGPALSGLSPPPGLGPQVKEPSTGQLVNGSAASQPDASSSGMTPAQKQVRALKKKLEACDALAKRKAAGETLTQPELEKLSKAEAW